MGDVPEKSDAGFLSLLHHNRDFCLVGVNLGGTTRLPSRPNGQEGILI